MKESKKRDEYLDFARELKKIMEHKSDSDTDCNWCARDSQQRISTRKGSLGKDRMSGDHRNYIAQLAGAAEYTDCNSVEG